MPIYEYYCSKCERDMEILVRGSEKVTCPECGSQKLEKQLSVPASPAINGSSLPVAGPSAPGTCGRPQCGSGCLFE